MSNISVSSDIIPIGEFKLSLSKWFNTIQNTGHPLVITQNGKPAGVLISPSEYDGLVDKKLFINSVEKGLSDAVSGNTYSTKELKAELKERRESRDSR